MPSTSRIILMETIRKKKNINIIFNGYGRSLGSDVNQDYYNVCPRSSDPFYVVTYYIKWVTSSRTDGKATKALTPPPPRV